MIWVQIGGFIDGYMDHQYSVDEKVRSTLSLNMDILVNMPCKYLDANVRDFTDDLYLAEEVLNFEGLRLPEYFWNLAREKKDVITPDVDVVLSNSLEADFATKGMRRNLDLPICRIFGSIPINRVQGDFHITAEGYGYRRDQVTPEEALNFTHFINEFSFGTFYPYIENTLDATVHKTDVRRKTYQYDLKVIPTVYGKLGHEIDTNQYSVRMYETENKHAPGIFIKYDFDPIKMSIIEKRLSFFQFVIRLVTIVGGFWTMAGWGYRVMEKMIVLCFGKEVARRGEEKKGGLLDEPTEEFESI